MSHKRTAIPRLGVVLVLSLILAAVGGGAGAATDHFTDDNGNFHEVNINFIADLGITNGCNKDGTLFCPDGAVTRAAMASFLVRALSLPATTTNYFTDDEGNTHEANINSLAAAGITNGCFDGTTFCPDTILTRAQMATMIVRALKLVPWSADYFVDVPATSFHGANINALAGHGITAGCTTDSFCPNAIIQRDQMASFLARMVQLGTDRAPTVSITSPAHLATFLASFDGSAYSKKISFAATASGTSGLEWRSSDPATAWLSGLGSPLGTGLNPTATLAIPAGESSSQPTVQVLAKEGTLFAMDQIQIKIIHPSP